MGLTAYLKIHRLMISTLSKVCPVCREPNCPLPSLSLLSLHHPSSSLEVLSFPIVLSSFQPHFILSPLLLPFHLHHYHFLQQLSPSVLSPVSDLSNPPLPKTQRLSALRISNQRNTTSTGLLKRAGGRILIEK